jgi:DNA repair protein RecN (Recombination protein N)
MMGARLEITLHPRKDFAIAGNDLVQFAFSANRGLSPQPLTKIASGGELSRVMLALKAILSETEGLPTIIFDEIDTGISGDTATKVAHILREMGLRMQVIAITHLPQIAAAGKRQYRVSKSQEGAVATTVLKEVLGDDRLHAIAKMLSGEQLTPAALANAKELMAIFENA